MPNMLGGLALGFIWQFIFQVVFTDILFGPGGVLHIEGLRFMTQSPVKALFALLIMTTWQNAGYMMIIYVGGLNTISGDLYEAASLDGANAFQRFRKITLPLLMPSVTVVLFLTLSNSFKLLDQNVALTDGEFGTRMLALQILRASEGYITAGLWSRTGTGCYILCCCCGDFTDSGLRNRKEGGGNVMKLLSENYIFYMRFRKGITYFFLIVLSIVTMLPLLFLLINAFKSQAEIIRNPLALPTSFDLRYLKTAFQAIHFGRASIYTLTFVAVSLVGIIFFSSLCAWMIARRKSRGMKVLYFLFVAAMLIPFQVIMYPLISILEKVSLKNLVGLIILYTGFGISMSVFMMTGYIKSVPKDIEESAVIDGANISAGILLYHDSSD